MPNSKNIIVSRDTVRIEEKNNRMVVITGEIETGTLVLRQPRKDSKDQTKNEVYEVQSLGSSWKDEVSGNFVQYAYLKSRGYAFVRENEIEFKLV